MSHYDTIRLHGVERSHGVEQRFALLQARRFGLQVHLVRAQPGSRRGKADSRSGGGLKKSQRHGFSAQRGEFLQRMPLDFLKRFGLVQEKCDFFGAERFDAEHVAEAK